MRTFFSSWLATFLLALCLLIAGCTTNGSDDAPNALTPSAPQPLGVADYSISGPYTHDNLTVYLILGKDTAAGTHFITLAEAMEQNKVVVHETQDVNNLQIENVSNDDIWVQSGDIVKGGQQDRTFANDCIIPPKSGKVDMAAFCVESGRWSARANETVASFSGNNNTIQLPRLKGTIQSNGMKPEHVGGQGAVWNEVQSAQMKLSNSLGVSSQSNLSSTSMQLTLEKSEVKQSLEPYLAAIQKSLAAHPNALGYVAAVNGKICTIDIYGNHNLFAKLWPKLINSTCTEAVAEFEKGKAIAPVTVADVRTLMQSASSAKETASKDVANRAALRQRESDTMYFFDCYDKSAKAGAAPVHQSMLVK